VPVVRMVTEVHHEYPSEWAAVESVADKLGSEHRRRCSTGFGDVNRFRQRTRATSESSDPVPRIPPYSKPSPVRWAPPESDYRKTETDRYRREEPTTNGRKAGCKNLHPT
jgi:hypothetical protein